MDKQYDSAKEGRMNELNLISAISMKVEEHYAKLAGKDSVQASGQLDNFDNTYDNEYDYVGSSANDTPDYDYV